MVSFFMVTARHYYRLARIRTCFPDELHETLIYGFATQSERITHSAADSQPHENVRTLFTALFEFDTRFWQFRRDQHVYGDAGRRWPASDASDVSAADQSPLCP
jgi:hypothetical protein